MYVKSKFLPTVLLRYFIQHAVKGLQTLNSVEISMILRILPYIRTCKVTAKVHIHPSSCLNRYRAYVRMSDNPNLS